MKWPAKVWNAMRKEPVGLFGLFLALLALIPVYEEYFGRNSYLFEFSCSRISFNNSAMVLNGTGFYDFVALQTRCDFSNLDNQTISIKRITPTGVLGSDEGHVIAFKRPKYGDSTTPQFNLPVTSLPYSIPPGEVFLFDDFFLIPIRKSWRKDNKSCANLDNQIINPFWEIGNCLPQLQGKNFLAYLTENNIHVGVEILRFKNYGIQITLTNDTILHEKIKFDWTFSM